MNILRTEAIPGSGRRVFIPSLPTRWDAATGQRVGVYNLHDAAQFGVLFTLSADTQCEEESLTAIKTAMSDYDNQDYILAIGDVARIIAAVLAAQESANSARLLQWDKRAQKYFVTEVVFE